jgi:hypothetical protein
VHGCNKVYSNETFEAISKVAHYKLPFNQSGKLLSPDWNNMDE